jgi:hypothetical protein
VRSEIHNTKKKTLEAGNKRRFHEVI